MRISYSKIEELPPLAWFATCKNGECKVLCGSHVETNGTFFVEGVWDGTFNNGDFRNAEFFCGSGGAVIDNKVIFSTPSHVTSGLFVSKIRGGVCRN